MADNSYQQIYGIGTADNSTKTGNVLVGVAGKRIRVISCHINPITNSSGGTGIITVRDGTGGTVLWQLDGSNKAGLAYDFDFHDGIGYPLTVGNSLSVEVSGATTDASVRCIAV